ncbi:2-oxoacid:acceptor oxidoreductase family protein [Patescibacteria group bacterium AH-259-L05]|nr:2-oxoacid:acceptor oxidoreductase family protein [Patescibacteria group bacterium AH-259-L05]
MKKRMKLVVAGQSGDGATRTVGETLGTLLNRLNLMAHQTYRTLLSVIMSPDTIHTSFPISREQWLSPGDEDIDVCISLEPSSYKPNPAHRKNPAWDIKPNRASIIKFQDKIVNGGCIIYDSSKNIVPIEKLIKNFKKRNIHVYPLPAAAQCKEIGLERAKNIYMVGAFLGLINCNEGLQLLYTILEKRFISKGQDIVDKNITAAQSGFKAMGELIAQETHAPEYKIVPPPPEEREQTISVTGNEAFCIGALAAGCRALVGYPISPASPHLDFMSQYIEKYGGMVIQASSEIAAIHTVIGFAVAGMRAYTPTSGPGLSLMIEGIGHAAMMEIPTVILDAQRAGPDTGMPTKPEQADFDLVKAGSHGDIPKIILAPSDHEECLFMAAEAFNLAEIYQGLVIVLLDQTIAEGKKRIPKPDLSKIKIDRGKLLNAENLAKRKSKFQPHQITPTGVSSWIVLGKHEGTVIKKIGAEHTESGEIDATPEGRNKMHEKRMRKMDTYLRKHFKDPHVYGDIKTASIILVGWGSTKAILCDVLDRLEKYGINAALVHFTHLWPLDKERIKKYFPENTPVAVIEQNYTGQFANILEQILYKDVIRINKYSGKPFEPREILEKLQNFVQRGGISND